RRTGRGRLPGGRVREQASDDIRPWRDDDERTEPTWRVAALLPREPPQREIDERFRGWSLGSGETPCRRGCGVRGSNRSGCGRGHGHITPADSGVPAADLRTGGG
ncbi:MAG TPA: hypothetical protein DC048_01600, partial [Planctomycetaceae bacterium]|nr:hypothetical protein [Planctomycetaceae bacterium]